MVLQSETMSLELLKKVMNKLSNLHAMQFCQPEEYQGCFSYTV